MPVCHEGSFYWEEIISSLPRFHRVFSLQDVMGYIHQDAMGHIQFLKNIDDTVDGKIQLTCWYGKYPISYRSLYTPGTPGGFLAGFLMNEARSYKRFSLCCYSKQPESPIDNQNPSPLHPNPSTVQDSPCKNFQSRFFDLINRESHRGHTQVVCNLACSKPRKTAVKEKTAGVSWNTTSTKIHKTRVELEYIKN